MEDASDPLDTERALDGAVRLSSLPLADRAKLAEPLLKRARQAGAGSSSGSFSGFHRTRANMASLALTWATGEMPDYMPRHGTSPVSMSRILSARCWEACELITGGHGFPLLATPEFADGSISHDELLARRRAAAAAQRRRGRDATAGTRRGGHPPNSSSSLAATFSSVKITS